MGQFITILISFLNSALKSTKLETQFVLGSCLMLLYYSWNVKMRRFATFVLRHIPGCKLIIN